VDNVTAEAQRSAQVHDLVARQASPPTEPPDPPMKSPVAKMVDLFAAAHDLVHYNGAAFALARMNGYTFGGQVGVAQPFGPELRRSILRTSRMSSEIKMMTRAAADMVLDHLASMAFDGPETPLALRFHERSDGQRITIDLGRVEVGLSRSQTKVMAIGRDGWEVAAPEPGVYFRRSHAVKPLPVPEHGGRLDVLADLLDTDPDGEPFRAMLGWVIGLPFVASVRPGLMLVGPPGSGKSTTLRLLASIVEPSGVDALGSSFGQNFGDDQVRAFHRALPLWDNLTSISGNASDSLCCLVTGTAREVRTLYTDSGLSTFPISRPVGLTAVGVPAGLRPDALDRLIVIELERPARRVSDAELQRRFTEVHPLLLGALGDAVSAALRWRDRVQPPTEYRMAALAHILAATDAAVAAGELPGCPGGLLQAYAGYHRRIKERTVADDVFGSALISLLEARGGAWRGKASELVLQAGMYAGSLHDRYGPGWPSTPRRVPEVLAHLQDGLNALGVHWQKTTVNGSAVFAFTLTPRSDGQP